jgi:formate--tetrahydrofolate ligase
MAQGLRTRDIRDVAAAIGLGDDLIEVHGPHRAKVRLAALESNPGPAGRYVLVTATTPTPQGEGKTVTAIGLSMALGALGHRSALSIRQSSLGPVFGLKGGGAGGGAAAVEPIDEAVLGLGSDFFAIETANNLLAAVLEEALHRGTAGLDPKAITWRRAIDMDDRSLRNIVVGLGGELNGVPRETGFDITAASEVMTVMALSRDLRDMRERLARIVPAFDNEGLPVTAERLGAAGAMAVVLRSALQPNLMQTCEGTPVFIHTGPFGNIATGNSSVVADRIALPRVDYLVTEAGFAADMGAEKLLHLKAPVLGRTPDVAVLVTTIRALKYHGAPAGTVAAGVGNMLRHIAILKRFGLPVVVAINRFPDDTDDEVEQVRAAALGEGAVAVEDHDAYVRGGEGALDLARSVVSAAELGATFKPLYRAEDSPVDKVAALATKIYGAADVRWSPKAEKALARFVKAGYGGLPICMAKTHLSLSHDPSMRGAPSGYTFPVQEVRLAAGAGLLNVLAGDIQTMPGLPSHPRAALMDLDENGNITGLE